jgi:hypothetical protein
MTLLSLGLLLLFTFSQTRALLVIFIEGKQSDLKGIKQWVTSNRTKLYTLHFIQFRITK